MLTIFNISLIWRVDARRRALTRSVWTGLKAFIRVCVSICPHDKTKTAKKYNHQACYRDSPSWVLATNLILRQKVNGTWSHSAKKHVEDDRVVSVSLQFCTGGQRLYSPIIIYSAYMSEQLSFCCYLMVLVIALQTERNREIACVELAVQKRTVTRSCVHLTR